MGKILVVLGSTSTGKTDLALELAKKFNGEVVACDSRQVYRGLDVGTGKAPSGITNYKLQITNYKKGKGYWEIDGIRVWMYDMVELPRQYSVFDYVRDANEAIERVFTREKIPVVIGGTGLYLRALLEEFENLKIPIDQNLRNELNNLSVFELQKKLDLLSPTRVGQMNDSDWANRRRLIRAIEIILAKPLKIRNPKSEIRKFDALKIGLSAPRPYLYQKINEKVLEWFSEGIVQEVQELIKSGVPAHRFKELGLEYREIADNLISNKYTYDELIRVIQAKIRQYAKRQMTWFKKEKDVNWFDITSQDWIAKVEKLVDNWYNLPKLDDKSQN